MLVVKLTVRDKLVNMRESKKHEDWDAIFDPYHKLLLGTAVFSSFL
jgi:hypothetical protein